MTRQELERLLHDPHRQPEARARLRKELDVNPSTVAYLRWQNKLPPMEEARSVTLVSSYTIETMGPFLSVEAYLAGWRILPTYVQYGQWLNALMDPSAFDEGPSEAWVLLLHSDELFSPLESRWDARLANLTDAIQTFRSQRSTPLFVSLLTDPPALHTLALGESLRGRAASLADLNKEIRGLATRFDAVYTLDIPSLAAYLGHEWFDPVGALHRQSPVSHKGFPLQARCVCRAVGCLFRPRRKVLVVDLDNTLWGGIVGEDGIDGIAVGDGGPGAAYAEFQRVVRGLRASGILLAINSKNNEDDVHAVFESRPGMVLRWDDFSARRVNWRDKASNLKEIALELGLGLDSVVFVDDNPVECALIRQTLPMVEVVELGNDPGRFGHELLSCQAFDTLTVSREDQVRAESYRVERQRRSLQAQCGDLDSFLASIGLRVEIRQAEPKTLDRIYQLVSKTNQFNLTLERFSRERIQTVGFDDGALYSVALTDRFGDYGIIGALQLRTSSEALELAHLVISCRALGRRVEETVLAFCLAEAKARGCGRLLARFVQGPRNQPVLEFLEKYGFTTKTRDTTLQELELEAPADDVIWPPYVEVVLPMENNTVQ